jgi:hypothetical protein
MNPVIEKIQKLLVVSKNGGTESEMQTAMLKAQQLADRYEIDLATVHASSHNESKDVEEPLIEVEHITAKGRHRRPPAHKYIAWILCEHFGVRITFNGSKIWIFGRESKVYIAKYAYDYMHRTFNSIWRELRREQYYDTSSRNSVFFGIYTALDAKLKGAKDGLLSALTFEGGEELKSSYQMVLVGEKERVEEAYREAHPCIRVVRHKVGEVNSGSAYRAGQEAGSKIEIRVPIDVTNRNKVSQ